MSVHVTAWVYDHAPHDLTSGELVVTLILADHANSEGGMAYPSVARIAQMARMSVRNAQYTLRALVDKGVIEVAHEATNRRPTVYQFPAFRGESHCTSGEQKSSDGGEAHCTLGVKPIAPEPSIEPLVTPPIVPQGTDTPKKKTRSTSRAKRELDDAYWREGDHRDKFRAWYAEYPRKVDPQSAMKAWRLVLGDDDADDRKMHVFWTLSRQRWKEWRGRASEHVPYPATWINKREWEYTVEWQDASQ